MMTDEGGQFFGRCAPEAPSQEDHYWRSSESRQEALKAGETMTGAQWQHVRELIAILLGATALFFGIWHDDPAMMTIGAGLVGFSPAAKGPAPSDDQS